MVSITTMFETKKYHVHNVHSKAVLARELREFSGYVFLTLGISNRHCTMIRIVDVADKQENMYLLTLFYLLLPRMQRHMRPKSSEVPGYHDQSFLESVVSVFRRI